MDLNKIFDELMTPIAAEQPRKPFMTRITSSVYANPHLSKILDNIDVEYFLDMDDQKESKNLKNGKDVQIVEHLLEIAEQIGLGLLVEANDIYLFNEQYWQKLDEKLFKAFLVQVAIKCNVPAQEAKRVAVTEILYSQFIFSAVAHASSKDKKVRINLLNGTLEIKGSEESEVSELKAHNKEDYFKYQLNFPYDPNATAPMFSKYLNRVLPDIPSQNILFEYLGYILTKNMKLERVLIIYGSGANGKSVLFDIITALFGEDNISNYPMEQICNENGYYRAQLVGKLVNYASEFGGKIDHQVFKKMVSGEPVDARSPHERPTIIRDYGKFIFNANQLPSIENTDAFFRRPLILNFSQKISDEEKDISLADKIVENELSGVLNLIINGLQRLVTQRDFSKSQVVDGELKRYRKESDNVAMFIEEENWEKSVDSRIKLMDLYDNFKQYCLDNGVKSCSKINFGRRLRQLDIHVQTKSTGNGTFVCVQKIVQKGEENPFSVFTDLILNS